MYCIFKYNRSSYFLMPKYLFEPRVIVALCLRTAHTSEYHLNFTCSFHHSPPLLIPFSLPNTNHIHSRTIANSTQRFHTNKHWLIFSRSLYAIDPRMTKCIRIIFPIFFLWKFKFSSFQSNRINSNFQPLCYYRFDNYPLVVLISKFIFKNPSCKSFIPKFFFEQFKTKKKTILALFSSEIIECNTFSTWKTSLFSEFLKILHHFPTIWKWQLVILVANST